MDLIHTRRVFLELFVQTTFREILIILSKMADFGRFWPVFDFFFLMRFDVSTKYLVPIEFSVKIRFSFSRSASIPLAFAVMNMVVSPKETRFFVIISL